MVSQTSIKVGVGAVVFRGDDVLVIKRGKEPFKGSWSIPGGGLEFGESLRDATKREVREETSLEINILSLIDAFEALPRDNDAGAHVVMIDFVAEWVAGEPVAGDDADEAEFIPYSEALLRLGWDQTRRALERAYEIRATFAP